MKRLSHLDEQGRARMVDVGAKQPTRRRARAEGFVQLAPELVAAIRSGDTPKGDVFATARIAGIQAAKRAHELIPLCHPLPLEHIELDFALADDGVRVTAAAAVTAKTGVEMEALTAVSVAALTIYDMLKGISHEMRIDRIRLREKSGGKSGEYRAD